MPFLVYLAYSRATGKAYVGCTTKSLVQRRDQHILSACQGSPYKFHKALRQEGTGSFEWRVLGAAPNRTQMFAMERSFVARYNSYRDGYNSTPGGPGSSSDGKASRRKMPIPQKKPPKSRTHWLRR